ncbi:MAG: CPBP family intramembrane glutamic endopeptidase [Terriglobia bacterium]
MKKAFLAILILVALGFAAAAILRIQIQAAPAQFAAAFVSLALVLGVFVALTDTGFQRWLRHRAAQSVGLAAGIPFLLLVPYLIDSLGTGTFTWHALAKLAVYIAVPTGLLLPDRLHTAKRIGWRDFGAMLALALPISAGWLGGIWTFPLNLYFMQPFYAVCVGVYGFSAIRKLEGIGYRLLLRKKDGWEGLANLVGFIILAIPLGYLLHFIRFHPHHVSLGTFAFQLFAIYITVAIPEEVLFRGILQNFLTQSFQSGRKKTYGLAMASVIFGLSHLHHAPVPNWRYAIMATLAGFFYGNAYMHRQRTSASALTHALVDTLWHFWF